MPVQSKAQLKYMAVHHPKILRRWSKEGKLYEKGESYKDLPYKEKKKPQEKKALELVEADANPSTYSKKKTFVEVNYRKGFPKESCGICSRFQPPASCSEVEGIIKRDGRCDLFVESEQKIATLLKTFRRRQGEAIKTAQAGGANDYLARLLDKALEENKQLREELIRAEYEGEAPEPTEPTEPAGAEGPPEQPSFYQGINEEQVPPEQAAAPEGTSPVPPGTPSLPPEQAPGVSPGPEAAAPGASPVPPGTPPLPPEQAPGQPPAPGMEGQPPVPGAEGQPPPPGMEGMQPGMQPGMPPAPPPDQSAELMDLQMRLEEAEGQLEDIERENTRLRDENRALGLVVEDPAKIQGPAKTLYDKAGTNLEKIQDLPKERPSGTKIPKDTLSKLMGDAAGSLMKGQFGA